MAHGRRPYTINSLEALVHIPGRCDLLVFDGLCLDGLSPEEVLAMVNMHEPARIKCRYTDAVVPPLPRIFSSSCLPGAAIVLRDATAAQRSRSHCRIFASRP